MTVRTLCTPATLAPACIGGTLLAKWAPGRELCQIRRGYRAKWRDLGFSVESDSGRWTLHVSDAASHPLYEAQRSSAAAAKVAAAEFAVFHTLAMAPSEIPEKLARDLNWQEYW